MQVTRILNRGRDPVAPLSQRATIDSGRTSWSSASVVSTIETQSPEPRIPEEVTRQLEQTYGTSIMKKKVYIALGIVVVFVLICGIIVAIVLPLTLNQTATTTISTTRATTSIVTTTHSK
ncbi:unnamed protein product [Rotaria sp. Silwood2]|nr:unnamed protein product [Rotaria sp. Silwood2]CAF2501983.1 unnamed protein product [Rotaria sp. Silwood2]CAF2732606.1 unnamed protein product [Rotaria sp. Silwood2]CAF2899726.1 unnamed protein product [Rotaria sp. Silwood2]CAF3865624.1 unnamed protein product [Rotaria sp. Silwood2]